MITGLRITEKKEEPLLSRTKIMVEIDFDNITPKKEELKSKIASSLNAAENLVVVRSVYTKFGKRNADAIAYCYKSEESLKNIGSKQKKKKAKAENAEEKKEGQQ